MNAKTVDVNVGSLDDPSLISPTCHIWCESRLPWFDTTDALIRHNKEAPVVNES
ncbi:MAG: hypothetical protein VCA12_18340 [Pseudomonadales bacterium]